MKIQNCSLVKIVLILLAAGGIYSMALADSDDVTATNIWTAQNARFGPFGSLDHRSGFYNDIFPEPLLLEDTSLEPEGELQLNYLHTRAGQLQTDIGGPEIQKSFGVFNFELGVPYERFSDSDETVEGIGNIEFGARCPVYQSVSANGLFDNTAGVGVEVGIPVNSDVSKNTELEPGVFDDVALGHHFTVQTQLGYDKLFGGGDNGGEAEFEYGVALAYSIPHIELPIPGVERISPMFEVDGEVGLNQDEAGLNSVLGGAGFRVDFQSIGDVSPSFGVGYVFPMSSVARQTVHWGIVASFTFEL